MVALVCVFIHVGCVEDARYGRCDHAHTLVIFTISYECTLLPVIDYQLRPAFFSRWDIVTMSDFAVYEDIEDSFPQLKRQREIDEELRKAKQAHLYLTQTYGTHDDEVMLSEYMAVENESSGDDTPKLRSKDDETTAPPRVVNIRERNRRKGGSATMDDLPKEDIFGIPLPAPKKRFPEGGKRLGDGVPSLRGFARDMWLSMPPIEEFLLMASLALSLVMLVRAVSKASRRPNKRADDDRMERLERILSRMEDLTLRAVRPPPQYIMMPPPQQMVDGSK